MFTTFILSFLLSPVYKARPEQQSSDQPFQESALSNAVSLMRTNVHKTRPAQQVESLREYLHAYQAAPAASTGKEEEEERTELAAESSSTERLCKEEEEVYSRHSNYNLDIQKTQPNSTTITTALPATTTKLLYHSSEGDEEGDELSKTRQKQQHMHE